MSEPLLPNLPRIIDDAPAPQLGSRSRWRTVSKVALAVLIAAGAVLASSQLVAPDSSTAKQEQALGRAPASAVAYGPSRESESAPWCPAACETRAQRRAMQQRPPKHQAPPPPSPQQAWPFHRSKQQRSLNKTDVVDAPLPDATWPCSSGCPSAGTITGWPLRPFHRQHPLRAGLNERRDSSFHHGIDIQARDGQAVYAMQPGAAHIIAATGDDARVQVGQFIYWHIMPSVTEGEQVIPYRTVVGHIQKGYGHLHLSELGPDGSYLNPLRAGGSVQPYRDRIAPVIGPVRLRPDPRNNSLPSVPVFDPQSITSFTTYVTPPLAPAHVAWRLYSPDGTPAGPLQWVLRGSHNLDWSEDSSVFAHDVHKPGFTCFATRKICRPHWTYVLSGSSPTLGLSGPGRYRLTVYAWDWRGNATARDTRVRVSDTGQLRRAH